jgi:hypothetical protein
MLFDGGLIREKKIKIDEDTSFKTFKEVDSLAKQILAYPLPVTMGDESNFARSYRIFSELHTLFHFYGAAFVRNFLIKGKDDDRNCSAYFDQTVRFAELEYVPVENCRDFYPLHEILNYLYNGLGVSARNSYRGFNILNDEVTKHCGVVYC